MDVGACVCDKRIPWALGRPPRKETWNEFPGRDFWLAAVCFAGMLRAKNMEITCLQGMFLGHASPELNIPALHKLDTA